MSVILFSRAQKAAESPRPRRAVIHDLKAEQKNREEREFFAKIDAYLRANDVFGLYNRRKD